MFKSNTNHSIDLFGFSSSFYMKQFGLFMSDCIMLPKKLEVIYMSLKYLRIRWVISLQYQ